MKLDKVRMAGHPAVVLMQIRREVRPGVMSVQRRWKRRAMYRSMKPKAERVFLWIFGALGMFLAVMFTVSFLAVVYRGVFEP